LDEGKGYEVLSYQVR